MTAPLRAHFECSNQQQYIDCCLVSGVSVVNVCNQYQHTGAPKYKIQVAQQNIKEHM